MKINKNAIITGAGRGIGREIACELAQLGYKTILVSKSMNNLVDTANKIRDKVSHDERLLPIIYCCDISNSPELENTCEQIFQSFKNIDVLVNSAGIWREGSLDLSIEQYRELLEVNLVGQYSFLKAIVPVMKRQKHGYIFNITSRGGKYGFPGSASYCSSKFGLVGLSESLYRELAEFDIKVTSISPSWVNTDMAVEAGATISEDEMIQAKDISETIKWLLKLSPSVSVKDIELECKLRIK